METQSQKSRAWNLANKDRYLANKRASHHRHKDRYNARRSRDYHSLRGIFASLRTLARQRNARFDIAKDEFAEWYESTPKECFYCDCPQDVACKFHLFSKGVALYRLTFDKLIPEHGYTISNMVLACNLCNGIKSNALTQAEMREIGQRYIKPKWQALVQHSS